MWKSCLKMFSFLLILWPVMKLDCPEHRVNLFHDHTHIQSYPHHPESSANRVLLTTGQLQRSICTALQQKSFKTLCTLSKVFLDIFISQVYDLSWRPKFSLSFVACSFPIVQCSLCPPPPPHPHPSSRLHVVNSLYMWYQWLGRSQPIESNWGKGWLE